MVHVPPLNGLQPPSLEGMLKMIVSSSPGTALVARIAALNVHWSPGVRGSVSQRLACPTPAASPVRFTTKVIPAGLGGAALATTFRSGTTSVIQAKTAIDKARITASAKLSHFDPARRLRDDLRDRAVFMAVTFDVRENPIQTHVRLVRLCRLMCCSGSGSESGALLQDQEAFSKGQRPSAHRAAQPRTALSLLRSVALSKLRRRREARERVAVERVGLPRPS